MRFLWIFLMSVFPMTLMKSEELTSLPNYALANTEFRLIDTNDNNIMEPSECTSYFNIFKKEQSNSTVSKDLFLERIVSQNLTDAVGDYLFDQYDRVKDGVLNATDFDRLYKHIKIYALGNVTRERFIRFYDMLIRNAIPEQISTKDEPYLKQVIPNDIKEN